MRLDLREVIHTPGAVKNLHILFENEHILLVDKRPGLVVHPDEQEKVNTLLTHIQAYLYQKKEWSPAWERALPGTARFSPQGSGTESPLSSPPAPAWNGRRPVFSPRPSI